MSGKRPSIGDRMTVHGHDCVIVAVYKFGTLDVEAPDGRRWRVTGLPFT